MTVEASKATARATRPGLEVGAALVGEALAVFPD
jgi:hypothetical protein